MNYKLFVHRLLMPNTFSSDGLEMGLVFVLAKR